MTEEYEPSWNRLFEIFAKHRRRRLALALRDGEIGHSRLVI